MVPHVCPYFDEKNQRCDLRQPEYVAARNRHYLIMAMQVVVILELLLILGKSYV